MRCILFHNIPILALNSSLKERKTQIIYNYKTYEITTLKKHVKTLLIPNFENTQGLGFRVKPKTLNPLGLWKPAGVKFVRTTPFKTHWNVFSQNFETLPSSPKYQNYSFSKNQDGSYKCYWKLDPTILNKNWEPPYTHKGLVQTHLIPAPCRWNPNQPLPNNRWELVPQFFLIPAQLRIRHLWPTLYRGSRWTRRLQFWRP